MISVSVSTWIDSQNLLQIFALARCLESPIKLSVLIKGKRLPRLYDALGQIRISTKFIAINIIEDILHEMQTLVLASAILEEAKVNHVEANV